jgi:uncharacterized protein YydD (DUF2326 family)
MRLVELSANRDSFKKIRFNRSGLTIVVGAKSPDGGTYNGVGKSLLIELIHFCLGSNRYDEFESKIPGWEFTLEFELNNSTHKVARSTSNQTVLRLDEQDLGLRAFNEWLEQRIFSIPEAVPGLTYRSLIPKFIRRGQKQYNDPLDTGDKKDYDRLIRNAFLLGIDTKLIAQKATVRDSLVNLQTLRRNFRDDPLLREFYVGNRNADIHLAHLDRQIRNLEQSKAAFVVTENYYDLQKQADLLASQIEASKNETFLLRSAIANIDRSLEQRPDLPAERFKGIYAELMEAFKPESIRKLDDIASFHRRLVENRAARLGREKSTLLTKLRTIDAAIRQQQSELDRTMAVLGQARALDQYTALVNQIANLTNQAQKLRDYKAIDLEYSNREAALESAISDEVIVANDYLEESRQGREANFAVFKSLVEKFYPNAPAGISLSNNEGNNRLRFDLDVSVENDSSDGINEVRIFCYDMTLLWLRQGHRVDFIVHDSRLFANMDVRQRAMLFRVADAITRERGYQYIATLNPDFISGMQAEFEPEEFERIVTNNIVLELTDDSPSGKLLGVQVDMRYER